jgi:predicted DNA-binding protein YlxM (UPF0122 family)
VEKDLETVTLLDAYSGLLTEKQLRLCDMYYNQDYSLSEIAEIEHTTRQAARDGISKAKQKLASFEEALGLCEKRRRTNSALDKARASAHDAQAKELIDEISGIWGDDNGV